jgi:hypothetical protein
MSGGGVPEKDMTANYQLAQLARKQWADYQARFIPQEQKLIDSLGNRSVLQGVDFARDSIGKAFDAQRQGLAMDMARMGVKPTADQQVAMDRSLAAQQSSALVNAENTARQHALDRNLAVMSGGMTTMNRAVRGAGNINTGGQ